MMIEFWLGSSQVSIATFPGEEMTYRVGTGLILGIWIDFLMHEWFKLCVAIIIMHQIIDTPLILHSIDSIISISEEDSLQFYTHQLVFLNSVLDYRELGQTLLGVCRTHHLEQLCARWPCLILTISKVLFINIQSAAGYDSYCLRPFLYPCYF